VTRNADYLGVGGAPCLVCLYDDHRGALPLGVAIFGFRWFRSPNVVCLAREVPTHLSHAVVDALHRLFDRVFDSMTRNAARTG
jgi:hypothetical protein